MLKYCYERTNSFQDPPNQSKNFCGGEIWGGGADKQLYEQIGSEQVWQRNVQNTHSSIGVIKFAPPISRFYRINRTVSTMVIVPSLMGFFQILVNTTFHG